ncbi:MAG: methionine--tRNA ligase [bacterium JZ-2024 1]
MGSKFCLTTPLYYVNAEPHLGHTYTTVAADVTARFHRAVGDDVLFITGSDEHGQKLYEAARAAGLEPQEFTDRMIQPFISLWKTLDISYDYFVRTTQAGHDAVVQETFRRLRAKGDIYKDFYEGLYCVPCETFWTPLQAPDEKCPSCGRPVNWLKEENYFFRLSRYRDWLRDHIRTHPEFILPAERRNEVLARLDGEVRDLCISRRELTWGVPIPDDPIYSVYVWFDALHGYMTAAGAGWDDRRFSRYWPADLHLIGKDILWFHGAIWPAILYAADYPIPRSVFAHGFWVVAGEKMSKSKGNVLRPSDLLPLIGVEGLRYYLLREIPFGQDGSSSVGAAILRYNTELANDLGNLLQRSITLVDRYAERRIPSASLITADVGEYRAVKEHTYDTYNNHLLHYRFKEALETLNSFVNWANRYIDRSRPWDLARSDPGSLHTILQILADCLRCLAILYGPFLPSSSKAILQRLGLTVASCISWASAREILDLSGAIVTPGPPIFPRIKPEPTDVTTAPSSSVQRAKEEPSVPTPDTITIEEFQKVQLVTARILEATRVPNTTRLLALRVDTGADHRTIIAGIGEHYSPEELTGRTIILVANLQPARIRGLVSQGMLLAADSEKGPVILVPDREVPPGVSIR